MANTKISALSSAGALAGTEELPIVQSAATVKTTVQDIVDLAAPIARQIISGNGLTGGGDLSADRTLAVGAGTGISVAADAVAVDINGLSADATPDGAADYVMTYDASATTLKKVLLDNLPGGGGSVALDDLTDVDLTTNAPASGDVLTYDGSDWVPEVPYGSTRVATSVLTASATTSIPNNTITAITFGTVSIAGGFRGAGTPTNGFIIPATGVTHVRVMWFVSIGPINAAGTVSVRLLDGTAALRLIEGGSRGTGGTTYSVVSSGPIPVSGGETFTLSGFQNGGGTEDANAGASPVSLFYFAMEDVTPL
jgi:hypothetical protein